MVFIIDTHYNLEWYKFIPILYPEHYSCSSFSFILLVQNSYIIVLNWSNNFTCETKNCAICFLLILVVVVSPLIFLKLVWHQVRYCIFVLHWSRAGELGQNIGNHRTRTAHGLHNFCVVGDLISFTVHKFPHVFSFSVVIRSEQWRNC